MPVQVAHAVAVAVLERARIDLVDGGALPPGPRPLAHPPSSFSFLAFALARISAAFASAFSSSVLRSGEGGPGRSRIAARPGSTQGASGEGGREPAPP